MPGWLIPAVTASLIGTVTLSLAFAFLYREERTPFLKIWTWAWIAYAARFVFMLLLLRQPGNVWFLIANQTCALVSGFVFAWGLFAFMKRLPGRPWFLGLAAGVAWIIGGTLGGASFLTLTLPTFLFVGTIMIVAGRAFLRSHELPGAGRTLTGWTFILWGIHKINYPFLRPVEWFAPWGYGIGSLLALSAALGMILAYFRKNKNAWEDQLNESRRLTQVLKTSEERFRTLADVLPEIIFETDARGNFTYVNRASFEKTGFSFEDVAAGLNCIEVIAPEDRERAEANFRKVLGGIILGGTEYRLQRKDGSTFPALIRSLPIVEGGRIDGLRGVVIELTRIREAEEAMAKSQKLDSLAVLAGGIAHDFNNILTGVSGHVSLALMLGAKPGKREETLQILRKAEKSVDVASGLAKQLLVFSRGGTPVKETFDLRSVVEEALDFALRGGNVNHAFEWHCQEYTVDGDRGQIHQVFTNLALNAQQAMPGGGTVTVRCKNVEIGIEKSALVPGMYSVVSIRDEGEGIPRENIQRIFEPYFTTKEQGTGLGLAMCFTIIRRHGGWIDVSSERGTGSTFEIYLPVMEPATPGATAHETVREFRGGRILVMDDEPNIRETYQAMLVALDYEAVCVSNGEEMLRAYVEAKKSGSGFDAVITDLTIKGGLGGREAVKELLDFDADARAIVTSGYSDHDILGNYRRYGFTGVLPKPAKIGTLEQVLSRALHKVK